ncbi:MAG: bifunctional diaminohydroxyphosphoribosylaminopyrimidine deaminase/5-amino-6-(5-phosphoribosylamino)uracil reductase RibD [Gemmatimonadota bacterium]|nr:bifunctional diaminohydroxyphosphoribosylaminopyrimidine deaminase/5-amino-6-(5-phosphoribosylamino)uracil reductase RibD [Gemmatimonadota bacterium]
MTDAEAMARALELARRGWGRVAPNPLVGAVLLREGRLLADGYHAEFGGEHAEIRALGDCDDPSGATCVVTLEPCAHHGKTPPCADALIAAGVARVVFALPDPDPAAGGGADRLRQAGIEVEEGVGRRDAAALNAPFLWSRLRPERPFVALKMATSLDGFVADRSGASRWISGPDAREYAHWLRAGFDAVAVGRGTAVADDPALTVRGSVVPRVAPARVVFARDGELPQTLKLVRTAREQRTVVFVRPDAEGRMRRSLAGSEVAVRAASDLGAALRDLAAQGVASILVEGGGTLATALLDADLVDRVHWIQAPCWLGDGRRAFGRRTPTALGDARAWTVTERRALGPDTLLVIDRELCLLES